MSNKNTLPSMFIAEGYEENQKNDQSNDPWLEIYAQKQNNMMRQSTVAAIESHMLGNVQIPCMVIMFEGGIKGIIPAQESGIEGTDTNNPEKAISITKIRNIMRSMVGLTVAFKIMHIDKEDNLCILSRKQALEVMRNETWKNIKEGQIRTATVRNVTPYAVLVNIGGIEVSMPISEASPHSSSATIMEKLTPGDTIDVKIIKADAENKKLEVSAKEHMNSTEYWEEISNKYKLKSEYLATVIGIKDFGIFAALEKDMVILVKHSRYEQDRLKLQIGSNILVRITTIDNKAFRIYGSFIRILRA